MTLLLGCIWSHWFDSNVVEPRTRVVGRTQHVKNAYTFLYYLPFKIKLYPLTFTESNALPQTTVDMSIMLPIAAINVSPSAVC